MTSKTPLFIINFLGYYVSWFALVYTADRPDFYIGLALAFLFIGLHFYFSPVRKLDALLMVSMIVMSLLVESMMVVCGVLTFVGNPVSFVIPLWLILVWGVFALVINHSLSWLKSRLVMGVLLALVSAPLSYYSGEKLGAVVLAEYTYSLPVIAGVWMLILPVSFALASYLERFVKS